MMLFDTHAHINLRAFKDDAGDVMQRSLDAGVGVINVGTNFATSKQAVEILERYSHGVYAAVGLHPSHTYDHQYLDANESGDRVGREEFDASAYRQLAQHPRVVGIGECGLDYYRLGDTNNANKHANDTNKIKVQQKDAFQKQIELAREMDKALIIHCRPGQGTEDAYEDVLEIISNFKFQISNQADLRFEVHSFTGSLKVAEKFLALGGYLGFNGIITFDRTGNMEAVVQAVPLERILLETDAPYLAPVPYRGKRNEPAYVVEVAKKVAEWKGISYAKVAAQTTRNASDFFHLSL